MLTVTDIKSLIEKRIAEAKAVEDSPLTMSVWRFHSNQLQSLLQEINQEEKV